MTPSWNAWRACRLAQGQTHQVEGRALEDTLLDMANYAVLAILTLKGDKSNGQGSM